MNSYSTSVKAPWIGLSAMLVLGLVAPLGTALGAAPAPGKPAATTQPASPKTAHEAMQAAEKAGAFLMVIFYDQENDLVKGMDQTVTTVSKKSAEKIQVFRASVKDKAESETVAKYGIARAKLPLLLVFAPNGAITGGFEQKVTEEKLGKTLVSNLIASIIKAVRAEKVAVVLLQTARTKQNAASLKAAQELAGEPKLKGHVEIITGDPGDPKNQGFLAQCDIKKNISTSTLVLLAPPEGTIMGVFPGKDATKDKLLDALTPKSSGCCPGGGSCN